jgi:hypothetical protein
LKKVIKRSVYVVFVITALTLALNSCKKEETNIGIGIQPPGDEILLSFTDTVTAVAYSRREDSVRTDRLNTSMLGSIYDPVFGITTASVYTELKLSTLEHKFGDGAAIDSIIMSLSILGVQGDSLTPITFRVFELDEQLYFDSAYYSNQHTAIKETELGMLTMVPSTDSIMLDSVMFAPHLRFNLNGALAEKLLSGSDEDYENNESFRTFFKGIYITADQVNASGQGSIITMNLLTEMSNITVYYHNDEKDSLKYVFNFTTASARYSHYEHYDYIHANADFREHVIDGNTALGSNSLYLQSTGGVRSYLSFPSLKTLGGDTVVMAINEARLIFSVNDEVQFLRTPPRIIVAKAINEEGSTTFLEDQAIEGDPYFGGYYNSERKEYSFRLNRFVQKQILKPDAEDDFGLVLLIPNASSVAERLILGGGNADEGRIRLAITYSIVE